MRSLKEKADEKIAIQHNICNNRDVYKTQKHSEMTIDPEIIVFKL